MKLLFDQQLSFRLCARLDDLFPDSTQVHRLAMDEADDREIWEYAAANGYIVVTLDADFADYAAVWGPPPKVIWLRCGNASVSVMEALLRRHAEAVRSFDADPEAACLELR